MSQQSKQDNDKQLSEDLVALFLLILSYKNDKEFKKLLLMYKQNRDMLKEDIGKIYLEHIKDNKFVITQQDVIKEVNLLKPKLIKIGDDLKKQEDTLLGYILYKTYKDSFYKGIDILSKYKKIITDSDHLKDKVIKDSISSKINGKTNVIRNKDNKEKFINKVKKDIKRDLIAGKSIEVINKTIDKDFNDSVNVSDKLIDNEVSRIFNEAIILGYKEMGIGKVEYNSTLDVNTCSECASHRGEVFNIEDAIELPLHVRCNCFYTPII